jgi:hypothetical protein
MDVWMDGSKTWFKWLPSALNNILSYFFLEFLNWKRLKFQQNPFNQSLCFLQENFVSKLENAFWKLAILLKMRLKYVKYSWNFKSSVSFTYLNWTLQFQGMVHQVLGLEFVCLVISLMGLARIISTWVSSHSAVIGPSYLVIGET